MPAKQRRKGGRPRGAEERLCSITYGQIARWVGLSARTVRAYSSQGRYDRRDVESVLSWVNARRVAAGLSLIGEPTSEPTNKPTAKG